MDEKSVVMRKIIGCMRKAADDYAMIEEGDRVAVGLSGGKDSLALLTALSVYRRFSPVGFDLAAINVDMGFEKTSPAEREALSAYVEELGVPYYVEKTDIAEIIFDVRKESNPCSLCSKMRRGALNSKCAEIGANKLALGHNAEDLIETFLLSLVYEGRLSTFQPVSYMSRSGITLIRPLIYVNESDIRSAVKRLSMPVLHNPCPMNHTSRREYMKELCGQITRDVPFAKDRILGALTHPERNNLFPPRVKREGYDEEE